MSHETRFHTRSAQPITVVLGGIIGPAGATIIGGLNWKASMYAFWEPFVAFGIILSLVCMFRDRFDMTNPWLKRMADAAYTVYIIHAPVVVGKRPWPISHRTHLRPP